MLGLLKREENDAAGKGTAVHAAIEACLDAIIAGQGALSLGAMVEHAFFVFDEIAALPNFKWKKVLTVDTVRKHMVAMLTAWYNEILPTLSPRTTEKKFGPILLHEDDEREIYIEGCEDYDDYVLGQGDWKTGSRPYEPWEKERWNKQSSFYTFAKAQERNKLDESLPFTFYLMLPNGEIQIIPVTRGPQHWAWLKEQAVSLAHLVEANLPVWPKTDDSALCSKKWCAAFAAGDCKGSHF